MRNLDHQPNLLAKDDAAASVDARQITAILDMEDTIDHLMTTVVKRRKTDDRVAEVAFEAVQEPVSAEPEEKSLGFCTPEDSESEDSIVPADQDESHISESFIQLVSTDEL